MEKDVEKWIQSGIIRPHGRSFAAHLLFKVSISSDSNNGILDWLNTIGSFVTSHHDHIVSSNNYKNGTLGNSSEFTIGFTQYGIGRVFNDTVDLLDPFEKADVYLSKTQYGGGETGGMARLEPTNVWGVIIIANDDFEICLNQSLSLKRSYLEVVKDEGDVLFEFGHREIAIDQNSNEKFSIDPLGYVDGISDNKDTFDSAFRKETWGGAPDDAYCSYLVMIKFAVFLNRFHHFSDLVSKEIKYEKMAQYQKKEFAKAMIMGRFPDGRPIDRYMDKYKITPNIDNNFDYDGAKSICPAFAHVRAVNPRNNPKNLPIVRRSMGLKTRTRDSIEKGLLFMSYQKSIARQFVPVIKNIMKNKDALLYSRLAAPKPRQTDGIKKFFDSADNIFNESVPNAVVSKGELRFWFPSIQFIKQYILK